MGVTSAELFNNMGLCCFYAQQFDMALGCFERALALAEDDSMADVWYNLSHVALGTVIFPLYQPTPLATNPCTTNPAVQPLARYVTYASSVDTRL
jgi:hypothetical protein